MGPYIWDQQKSSFDECCEEPWKNSVSSSNMMIDDNGANDGDKDDNLALIAPSVHLSSSANPQGPRLKIS